MKSVEFLVSLMILFIIFSFFYSYAKNSKELTSKKLEEINKSIQKHRAETLVKNLKIYGTPFFLKKFNFEPTLIDLPFNPLTQEFSYVTYSRWKN